MIINKLQLKNFGRFQNRELILKPGVNVIYGGNESGKSTIHTFLQSMLFGMKRMRDGLPEQIATINICPGKMLDGMKVP